MSNNLLAAAYLMIASETYADVTTTVDLLAPSDGGTQPRLVSLQ